MSKVTVQKGKALEQWWFEQIKQIYSDVQNIAKSKKRKSDISFGNWITECKNTKNFSFKEAAEQVKRDSLGWRKESILWHPHATPMEKSVVIINSMDFMELLKSEKNNQSSNEILDKYSIKSNLEKGIFFLKKVVKNL